MTETANNRQGLLTIAQFCQEYGISERSYFRMRAANRGPQITWVGGKQLITKSSVFRWEQAWTELPGKPRVVPALQTLENIA